MNKFLQSTLTAAFLCSVFSVSAATQPDNKDDASDLGTSDTPQIKEQMKNTNKTTNRNSKSTTSKSHMNKSHKHMKMMDTDNDGYVTRDEYMTSQEQAYEGLKPGEQGFKY